MLWERIQSEIAALLPESEYELWIKPLTCIHEGENEMVLIGPDRYFCAWVEERYQDIIRQQVLAAGGGEKISFQIAAEARQSLQASGQQLRLPGLSAFPPQLRSLHPAFTFDQFLVGESNILAQSACKALAEGDKSFGPCLFMDGATGLGKTHLTQAVVHQVLKTAPATQLRYLTAQQFSAEMVRSLREKTMEQFSAKYLDHCDMLLLEDVHTLSGRSKTQEELNIILDYLLQSGKRVILTSALPPGAISGLDAAIKSRMTAGLLASIQPPALETRVRIVHHKMAAHGMVPSEELASYLAERLPGDVRRLESAIMGLKAKSHIEQTPPDLAMAHEILEHFHEGEIPGALSAEAVCGYVGARFKVPVEDLRSRSRKRSVVMPRQMAMYLTRQFTRLSLSEIGGLYGRDHSTVLHAIKTLTLQMARSTTVREQMELLSKGLEKLSSH